ncbi:cupin domain-containing protein [Gemella sp. zg-570]|uniref:cupin domain-containing protein n=1 Tax=Gemella sp. zg-570 TaxID=2840371 RepID=UPI00352DA77C
MQYTVPKGVIFASSVKSKNPDDFAIVACVVTPAFTYEDFELFTQAELIKDYPEHTEIIKKLAYKSL